MRFQVVEDIDVYVDRAPVLDEDGIPVVPECQHCERFYEHGVSACADCIYGRE